MFNKTVPVTVTKLFLQKKKLVLKKKSKFPSLRAFRMESCYFISIFRLINSREKKGNVFVLVKVIAFGNGGVKNI